MTGTRETPDNPGSSMPDTDGSVKPSMTARWARVGLALALGFGAGWGVQQGIAWWQGQSSSVTELPSTFPQVQEQAFLTWIVMGSQAHSLDQGQISLPSGSRFQIRIQSPLAGVVSVSAINPAGETIGAPLWRGSVRMGTDVLSPMLRLEGAKGRETLVVVLQPSNGQATVVRSFHLWHL
jgi:hypothetical protein